MLWARPGNLPGRWVGLTFPVIGFALPAIGFAMPVIGFAMPAIGFAMPAIGLAMPAIGLAMPASGFAMPVIGLATPAIGFAMPVIGSTVSAGESEDTTTPPPRGNPVGSGLAVLPLLPADGGRLGEEGRGDEGFEGQVARSQLACKNATDGGSPSSSVRGRQSSSVRARESSNAQWRSRLLSCSVENGGRNPRIL